MANINLTDSSNIKVVQAGSNISLDFTTTGAIGSVSSLKTVNKSNLVNAVNEIYSDIFYQNGDIYNQSGFVCPGHITGGSTSVVFTLPLPKRLTNITSITVNALTARIRGTSGYINGSSTVDYIAGSYTVGTTLKDNIVSINISSGSALSGATNNTAIAVYIDSIFLTFNA